MELLDLLNSAMTGDRVRKVAQQLGTDEQKTENALGAALPALFGALARNSKDADGAASLHRALERDHDGSVLDDMDGFLDAPQRGNGAGILGHVLGNRRQAVESRLARSSGLDGSQMGQLMELAAPLVMGALGRGRRQGGGMDANGLADMLGRQDREVRSRPEAGGFLSQLLDQDGDGSIADDVAKAGLGFLGRMMRDTK